ncbi:hypothetical protein [Paraburkholderia aromaticivorans]|uniref:hypothetical protein n=1 Tax=Paraburkholderia aromaticivorans TaxID=2026199 RepID=UPI001455F2A3|nr:hypothetical protein [Paraburkholderia aromaticivorans]
MNTLGYVGSALVAFGSVAWTLTSAASRFDRTFDTDFNPPAPANDDRALPEARSRRASGLGSAMSMLLRKGAPAVPVRLRAMPPAADAPSLDLAACHYYKRCAICGEALGQYKAFILRPTAAVNRLSGSAPAHQDCAKYKAAGLSSHRGAGVVMVWVTRSYEVLPGADVVQLRIGDAEQVFWYRDNRCATRDEVRESFESALPALYRTAHAASEQAVLELELDTMVARATRFFPRHSTAALVEHLS